MQQRFIDYVRYKRAIATQAFNKPVRLAVGYFWRADDGSLCGVTGGPSFCLKTIDDRIVRVGARLVATST